MHRTPGWKARCILTVVLRDALTLCYAMSGRAVLQSFHTLEEQEAGIELLDAAICDSGVAVLG